MRSDDALATILLVSRVASDGLQPLKASEYWRLVEQVGSPGGLLGGVQRELTTQHGLDSELAERVVALLERATALAFELERLDQSGIVALTPFDEHYPQRWRTRLGPKAPPLLHAAGALSLLDSPALGVVGSRDVSAEGAEVAAAAAKQAVRLGLVLVSGAARGVDQLAMSAAFEAGGNVVGILADSLARTLKSPDVRRAVHGGITAMCTPYAPDAPFSAGSAMGRNKLIYAQSRLTLVVASDVDQGGTWSGAIEALEDESGRVAVWRGAGEGPGNGRIEERGAAPVRSVDELETLLRSPEPEATCPTPRATTQGSLFDAM